MTGRRPIVHLYFSPMEHESRLLRAAKAAVHEGLASNAVGLGYRDGDRATEETVADGVTYKRLASPRWALGGGKIGRLCRWPLWTLAAIAETIRIKPAVVQAHSLAALPAAIISARLAGSARLVYDAHELESERTGWSNSLRILARTVERVLIRFVDETLVVSDAIADWYADAYGIRRPHLVRNMPEASDKRGTSDADIRSRLGLCEDAIIFVYLGRLGAGRGITLLMEAFNRSLPGRHLVFMGDGPMEGSLRAIAATDDNVHVLPPVASADVIHFISSADVGLSIVEDVSLSYRYCLPNKLFETRMAGLPVIVSDLPEMSDFVSNYGGGWIVRQNTDDVVALINRIDKVEIARVSTAALTIPRWEDDRARYIGVIADLLGSRRHLETPPS